MQITYCMNASRLLNLAAIFSLDFESKFTFQNVGQQAQIKGKYDFFI